MIDFDKTRHKVAIIAPASACATKEEAEERLEKLISFFKSHGIRATYDENIFAGDSLAYFAASIDERKKQFENALLDPEVRIIFAFRGGYGCSNIAFDFLDVKLPEPKILIGFSDITVLHALFNQYYNMPSIHGPMDARNPEALEQVMDVLNGAEASIDLDYFRVDKDAVITGEVIGGNLAVLCSLLGTRLQPKTDEKILFLEDLNERGYQVHRYLVQMYHAGLLSNIKALIFGDFSGSDEHLLPSLKSFVEKYLPGVPVYTTNQIGHGEINRPVVMAAEGKIEEGKLTIQSPFRLV